MPEDQAAGKANLPQPYWGYEDIGIFLLLIAFISAVFRLAVRLHFISSSQLTRPTAFFQLGMVLLLSLSLYLLLNCVTASPCLNLWAGYGHRSVTSFSLPFPALSLL